MIPPEPWPPQLSHPPHPPPGPPVPPHRSRTPLIIGAVALLLVVGLAVGAFLYLRGDNRPGGPPTRTSPDPDAVTLGTEPPTGWKDLRTPDGLVYSVPPSWTALPDEALRDWGSGFDTIANAAAQTGYCGPPSSFRVRVGITEQINGPASELAEQGADTMAQSLRRYFTYSNTQSNTTDRTTRAVVTGDVRGAWTQAFETVTGTRDACTPPRGRFDIVALEIAPGSPGQTPRSVLFIMLSDQDEPGVETAADLDRVIHSLRFDRRV